MTLPVATALTDTGAEARLVAGLQPSRHGVSVVRRCMDLADLLATAGSGTLRAVLVSPDLPRFDGAAVARLAASGVGVVGVVPAGDAESERRLRELGVHRVVAADGEPAAAAEALAAAAAAVRARPHDFAHHQLPEPRDAVLPGAPGPEPAGGDGSVVAVWGPTGAPGRTTVAVGLAAEVAALGRRALLVDADVYGGVVAQVLGLLDESAGIAGAARLATQGGLDPEALAGLAVQAAPGLAVLSGIVRAQRWPELRPSAVETVLRVARAVADVVVVDCGFCLEQDEELSFDTAAPRRNGATLAVLEAADAVVAVGAADPVGIARLVRGLAELRETVPAADPVVVVNRVRRGVVEGNPAREVRAAVERYAGVSDVVTLPDDRPACDRALAAGRTIAEAAPKSPLRQAIRELAGRVAVAQPVVDAPRRGARRVATA